MAMSIMIRRELGKSRESLWQLLEGKKCCFCKKPLLPEDPGLREVWVGGLAPAATVGHYHASL